MAETLNRGPLVSIGSLMDGRVENLDGPVISYQGEMIPNPAYSPANKDSLSPGAVKGWFSAPYVVTTDTIPSANSTTTIAAAQAPSTTAGVALNLKTAVLGTAAGVPVWAPGIPIVPAGTTVAVIVSAIDFGFTTGTTVAGSTTVVVVDNSLFDVGQWVIIAGAGSAGATNVALTTQIQSLSTNSTVLTILPAALTALSNAPIGQANLYNPFLPPATQFGPSAVTPSGAEPYVAAGFGLPLNPLEGSARALNIQSAATASGTGTFLVSGYDIYGVAMSELITASGTSATSGKKAFKYVASVKTVTAGTTVTPPNVTVGVTDIFGYHVRTDKWEYTDAKFGGTSVINSSGWTAALSTTSSTTTMDVRGTLNASTAFAVPTDGVRRLFMAVTIPVVSMVNATPLSTNSVLGTAQV